MEVLGAFHTALQQERALRPAPAAFDSPGDTCPVVKEFREGFGEAIGNGLDHDRFIDMVSFAKFVGPFVGTVNAYDEASKVVRRGRGS